MSNRHVQPALPSRGPSGSIAARPASPPLSTAGHPNGGGQHRLQGGHGGQGGQGLPGSGGLGGARPDLDTGPTVRQRVGPALKARRQRRRLSLHALAAQAGISPSHLSRIERGLSVPSYDVLDRVADALGSDLRALRTEEASARAVDGELDALFDSLGLAPGTRGELLQLSSPARADLARALRRARRST